LSKSRLSCMFCARMYCCSLVRYVSSISSYMDSSCTISRVICRALPVRCLCRLEARLADSMRASRLRSLRRDAAMNALCGQPHAVNVVQATYRSWFSSLVRLLAASEPGLGEGGLGDMVAIRILKSRISCPVQEGARASQVK
jgi:hypothetical protein